MRDDRGPPPVANSRFAAAAESDRSYQDNRRDDRGPPPVANSRFADAAAADQADRPPMRDDRGPPPVANSRFANAAYADEMERPPPRDDRDNYGGRGDDRGAQPPQNSRFGAAMAADGDYVDREQRQRRDQDRFDDDRGGGDRFGGGDRRDDRRGDDRRGGGRDDFRGDDRGRGDDRRGGGGRDDYGDRRGDDRRGDSRGGGMRGDAPPRNRVDDLLKPKVAVVADNILQAPTKVDAAHADGMLMMPTKAKEANKEEVVEKKASKPEEPAAPVISAEDQAKLLDEFASGNKMGDELKAWCEEQRVQLPSVEKLVFHMLTEREKLNPDPECGWAETSKFGAALCSLVEEDIVNQMQVLWGIQMYCDKIGFPKLNDEYVVQSMYRAMYKFDLAEADAFMEWKEDEGDEHEQGKMKAVIQTVDWFNWLDEDDEEEYEEEE
jgi:hypothetical protein